MKNCENTYRGSSSAIVEYDEVLEQIRERLNNVLKLSVPSKEYISMFRKTGLSPAEEERI